MQGGAGRWREVQGGGGRCRAVEGGGGRCRAVEGGAGRCREVEGGASIFLMQAVQEVLRFFFFFLNFPIFFSTPK